MSEPFQPTIDAILSEPPRRPPSTETNAFRSPLSPIAAGLRADFEAGNPSPPATVSSLRARIEAAATGQGGRSPAAIPEPIIHHPPGDSRLEPQIPDMPIPRSINTHIGDPTGRTAVTIIDMPARPANSQMSPHAPRNPSKLSSPPQTAEIDIITQLPTPKMKPDELIVPLPLFSRIQEQYMSTIGHYQNATRNILSLVTPDEDSIREVEEMMMRLNRITNHVDLDDPTTDWNEELSMEEESRWAVQNSSKFAFLNHLISRLGKESIHLAIVAESGRLLDILARFLCAQKAAKVSILNTGAIVNHHIMTDLRISLLPSGRFEPRAEVAPASLVLAFDSSFDAEVPAIRALRYNPSGRLSPIIYLMVHSSVEHLKLCAPPMKNPLDSLRVMTQCVIQTRAEVGELLPEDYSALPAAEEVAHFICNGCNPNFWSLLNPRSINLKGLELLVASQETPPLTADGESSRRKRQIDPIADEHLPMKRSRSTHAYDITHISNSIPSQNSEIFALREELNKVHIALKAEQDARTAAFKAHGQAMDRKEKEVREYMAELNTLQDRYEELSRKSNEQRHETDRLEAEAEIATSTYSELLNAYEKFKSNIRAVQEEKEEEAKPTESPEETPSSKEPTELDKLQAENKTLTELTTSLERRLQTARDERDYAHKVYQEASSRAVESADQANLLEEEVARLRPLADGERTKERTINNDAEVAQYRTALDKAHAELEEMKEQMRRKERGRGMATRAGSTAPRSPRPGGSPTGTRSRANSRAPASRPVSPISRSYLGSRRRAIGDA